MADDAQPPLKATASRDDDQVELTHAPSQTTLAIRSPRGISSATIERTGHKWPTQVAVRLHLKGLESFQVTGGQQKLNASVSSQNGSARLWLDDKETEPLDVTSPYWTELRLVRSDDAGQAGPAVPPEVDYIELQLPQALFADNPREITIHWIDFYRN